MDLLEELAEVGANINEGLQRLGGKSDFYAKMLLRVPALIEEKPVTVELIKEDPARAVEYAHALKGVFGNLSVTPLYEAYSKIVSSLRDNKIDDAANTMKDILLTQKRILAIIEKHK